MKVIKKLLFISLLAGGVSVVMKKLRGKSAEPAFESGVHDHTGHDHSHDAPATSESTTQDTNP